MSSVYPVVFELLSAELMLHILQTTYENFRYRADNRINAYDVGCSNNFLEIFCSKIKPSKNNFRAYVQEEVQRPPLTSTHQAAAAAVVLDADTREKVEDDLGIGEDLLKISQRRNIEEINEELCDRGGNGTHQNSSEVNSVLDSDYRSLTIQAETRHSSWGRRSSSWEIAPDVLATNSKVTESRSHVSAREANH